MSLTPDIERVLTQRVNDWLRSTSEFYAQPVGSEKWVAGLVSYLTSGPDSLAALVEQREETAINAFLDTLPAHLFSEHTARQIREWADEWRQG